MSFNPEDFKNKEVGEKLHVITMSKLNKYPLTRYDTLTFKEKRIANEILNEYIHKLPEINWNEKLTKDFNQICVEEIFENSKIDFTSLPVKQKSLEQFPIEENDMVKHLI